MITIIPSLEVMKAVTDNNISSSASDLRRQAFDKATDLMTLGNVEVLIEGLVYERVENKLVDEHKVIFQSGYRIDNSAKGSPTWAKMYKMFAENYFEFAEHYHKRSNVESCFAMIKRKFGDSCRCKSDRSQNNEIRCKILTHNLVVLIHELFELKIDIDFLKESRNLPAQKVI